MPTNPYEPPKEPCEPVRPKSRRSVSRTLASIPLASLAGFAAFMAGVGTWHFLFPYRLDNNGQIACGVTCAGAAAALATVLTLRPRT
jgi:hypothetical protein